MFYSCYIIEKGLTVSLRTYKIIYVIFVKISYLERKIVHINFTIYSRLQSKVSRVGQLFVYRKERKKENK